jgi:hypothetical protein
VTVDQLRPLVAFNRWANTRLLQAAAALSVEELERDLRASFGSLQGTLSHILWGERGWLHFWREGTFVPTPTPPRLSGFCEPPPRLDPPRGHVCSLLALPDTGAVGCAADRRRRPLYPRRTHPAHSRPLHFSSGAGHAAFTATRPPTPIHRLPCLLDGGSISNRLTVLVADGVRWHCEGACPAYLAFRQTSREISVLWYLHVGPCGKINPWHPAE